MAKGGQHFTRTKQMDKSRKALTHVLFGLLGGEHIAWRPTPTRDPHSWRSDGVGSMPFLSREPSKYSMCQIFLRSQISQKAIFSIFQW